MAPFGLFGKDLPHDQFAAGYRKRLDGYGVEGIRTRIERVAADRADRPLLLCCFEKRLPTAIAAYSPRGGSRKTGEAIPEWERPAPPPDPRMTLTDDPKENA